MAELNTTVKQILEENVGSRLTNALILGLTATFTKVVIDEAAAASDAGKQEGYNQGLQAGVDAASQGKDLLLKDANGYIGVLRQQLKQAGVEPLEMGMHVHGDAVEDLEARPGV